MPHTNHFAERPKFLLSETPTAPGIIQHRRQSDSSAPQARYSENYAEFQLPGPHGLLAVSPAIETFHNR